MEVEGTRAQSRFPMFENPCGRGFNTNGDLLYFSIFLVVSCGVYMGTDQNYWNPLGCSY